MRGELRLHYKRVGDGFVGKVYYQPAATRGLLERVSFDGLSFARMMETLSALAQSLDAQSIVFKREEREDLKPVVLDEATVELLKSDVAEAIRLMSPPPVRVVVRDTAEVKVEKPALELRPVFAAGYDTLAEAFGEDVYCRRRQGRVESPITGRWNNLMHATRNQRPCLIEGIEPSLFEIFGYEAGEEWFKISTQELLDVKADRYFLPRAWNTKGPWISREDLENKLNQFRKEKEECSKIVDDR